MAASGLVPGSKGRLEDLHFLPVQHSLRARRVDASDASRYGRAKVEAFVARELELHAEHCGRHCEGAALELKTEEQHGHP